LHLVEGELPQPALPVVPGHQVVGVVDALGDGVTGWEMGERAGVPWLGHACGACSFCRSGRENLCESACFTGYQADGGYAEYALVHADYAVRIPPAFSDAAAAPLLCAGIVGYRSLRLSGLQPGERLGIYGFGGSGHLCIQVARYWGCEVYVFTRSVEHQQHARELNAAWVGVASETPPAQLDRAIIFAPAGWLVPLSLGYLRPGGSLCINAIHASPIPEMPYRLLWKERTITTVANATRRDAREFMELAAEAGVATQVQPFPMRAANEVLQQLKHGRTTGSAVLIVREN
jgi:propanol-preferring alcohol dehydrogenase